MTKLTFYFSSRILSRRLGMKLAIMASGCRTGLPLLHRLAAGATTRRNSWLLPLVRDLELGLRNFFHGYSCVHLFCRLLVFNICLYSFCLLNSLIGLLNLGIYWCWWQALLLPHPERGLRSHGSRGLRRALATGPFEEEATKMIYKVVFSFPLPVVNVYRKRVKNNLWWKECHAMICK